MLWVASSDLHMLSQGMHMSFLQAKQRHQKDHDVRYLAVTYTKRIELEEESSSMGQKVHFPEMIKSEVWEDKEWKAPPPHTHTHSQSLSPQRTIFKGCYTEGFREQSV